jgi:hypothetical protein
MLRPPLNVADGSTSRSGEGTDMPSKTNRLPYCLHFALRLGVALALTSCRVGMISTAGPFDGTYKGSQTILRSDNGAECMHRDDIAIAVRDGRFNWIDNSVFVSTTILDVAITAEGSFSKWGSVWGLDGTIISPVNIEGKITGNKLEADIDGGFSCISHLSLTKS